jgi:pyruvate dehydrogenase (quinone)
MIRQGLKAKVQDMLPGGKQRQDKRGAGESRED